MNMPLRFLRRNHAIFRSSGGVIVIGFLYMSRQVWLNWSINSAKTGEVWLASLAIRNFSRVIAKKGRGKGLNLPSISVFGLTLSNMSSFYSIELHLWRGYNTLKERNAGTKPLAFGIGFRRSRGRGSQNQIWSADQKTRSAVPPVADPWTCGNGGRCVGDGGSYNGGLKFKSHPTVVPMTRCLCDKIMLGVCNCSQGAARPRPSKMLNSTFEYRFEPERRNWDPCAAYVAIHKICLIEIQFLVRIRGFDWGDTI